MQPTDQTAVSAPPGSPRWEYRELTVYLNLSTIDLPGHQSLVRRFGQILERELRRVAADGWEPDGPTDWRALEAAGRLTRRQASVALPRWTPRPAYVYDFARVRLRRPLAP